MVTVFLALKSLRLAAGRPSHSFTTGRGRRAIFTRLAAPDALYDLHSAFCFQRVGGTGVDSFRRSCWQQLRRSAFGGCFGTILAILPPPNGLNSSLKWRMIHRL